ncbi:MAG: hypothetical protein M3R24_26625 [Chloroflexota bacterium]|nr:hypothetical protein [Chloroflexota bacterium]
MTNRIVPALFRTGDIGVSAEWRDISYDWLPVLTKHGVAVYSYLRDTYDHQRNLRPFLITPHGPTKQKMQTLLGLDTDFALVGPEFLLTTVGLVYVDVDYRHSTDPDRPNRTHVTCYTVGRLDHPVLDWSMLERILNAVCLALEPAPANKAEAGPYRKAEAALRSLGNAGFLQHCDPADLFYDYGAWPALLPALIHDERWVALYTHLHGAESVASYRKQARAWVAYAQRTAARLMEENCAMGDMLVAAQRGGSRGGGSPTDAGTGAGFGSSPISIPGATVRPQRATKPPQLNPGAFVAEESLPCPKPPQLNQGGSATHTSGSRVEAINPGHPVVAGESLRRDQLTSRSCWETEGVSNNLWASSDNDTGLELWELPPVEDFIRDDELTTTRQDHRFWCEVNQILSGSSERYAHSAGEKKAAERRFKQQDIPVGVILAALRAVITLPPPQRPTGFADALKMDVFHGCVQRVLAVLPARTRPRDPDLDPWDWTAFLHTYRAVGMTEGLRNLNQPDYHVLKGLFERQPDECWDVLSRIMHAATCPADLSPRYIERAIINNQREAAQCALIPVFQTAPCRAAGHDQAYAEPATDPRRALLVAAGLKPQLLQPQWTEAYIRAWIAEADRRAGVIKSRVGWLIWGLQTGFLPDDHPKLPPCSGATTPSEPPTTMEVTSMASDSPERDDVCRITWSVILAELAHQLPQNEFATWLKDTWLIDLDSHQAIVGTSNIFARETLEGHYVAALRAALAHYLGYEVHVEVVIGC